tara:strand:- start:6977 stop:7777 length:801 start_codon:yes stop_codon:yes gene_type:complete
MNNLRKLISQMILEAFREQDVEEAMIGDTRQRKNQKTIFGSHAKDLFRQQREADQSIDSFLNSVITIHWKPINKGEHNTALDDRILIEPLQNTSTKDELSCTPYLTEDEIPDKGWHVGKDDILGIQVKGYVTWLEHGDAQTGHGRFNVGNKSSGANKRPRQTYMGRDPGKGNQMGDVIQSVEDYEKWDTLSTYGDGEALVDNWTVEKIWYKDGWDQLEAWMASKMLGKRFNKQIPFQHIFSDTEQLDYTDFVDSYEGWEPEGEWTP